MKKSYLLIAMMLIILIANQSTRAETPPPKPLIGISVVFSTHARWDNETKGCVDRKRGWCLRFRIEINSSIPSGAIAGEITTLSSGGLTLTLNKKRGITAEMLSQYFENGKFHLDGEATIQPELASKLNLPKDYVIPEGYYNYQEKDDLIIVTFKRGL